LHNRGRSLNEESNDYSNETAEESRYLARRRLATALADSDIEIEITRFGSAILTPPIALSDAMALHESQGSLTEAQATTLNENCAATLNELSANPALSDFINTSNPAADECVLLDNALQRIDLSLQLTNPVPMYSRRGLFPGNSEPVLNGHCPLPSTMDCAMLAEAIEYALLANCAYDTSVCPEPWVIVNPAGLGLDPGIFERNGFHAVLLYHANRHEYVLAFEGTDPTSFADWNTNIENFNGTGNAIQYSHAVELSTKVTRALSVIDPTANITYTGHSLGGGQASIAAMNTGHHATVFNSASVGAQTLANNRVDPIGHEGLIDVINTVGDIVTSGQNHFQRPAHGTHHTIGRPDYGGDSVSIFEGIGSHVMGNVITTLQLTYADNCAGGGG